MSDDSIGMATMDQDGTIIVQLRAEGAAGERGDAVFVYKKGDPQYAKVLAHLGDLQPGGSTFVRPMA